MTTTMAPIFTLWDNEYTREIGAAGANLSAIYPISLLNGAVSTIARVALSEDQNPALGIAEGPNEIMVPVYCIRPGNAAAKRVLAEGYPNKRQCPDCGTIWPMTSKLYEGAPAIYTCRGCGRLFGGMAKDTRR